MQTFVSLTARLFTAEGESNVGAAVGRSSDEVFAVAEVDAGDFSEVLDSLGRELRMRRHGRADGGSAEVDNLEVFLSFH